MSGYKMAFKKAFPYTIPVLTGYLFIGIAFGVMYAEKGYSFLWAMLMSLLVYAGSGQYLAVNFFVPGISFIQVIFMTLMVNVRHMSYWVIGSAIGGLAGTLIPFNSEGIDFAMTALFVVIFVEQWMDRKNRIPEMIGVAASFICLQIFGMDSFVLPSMILIILVLFIARTRLERQVDGTCQ